MARGETTRRTVAGERQRTPFKGKRVRLGSDEHDLLKRNNFRTLLLAGKTHLRSIDGYVGIVDRSLREASMLKEVCEHLGKRVHLVNFSVGAYDRELDMSPEFLEDGLQRSGFSYSTTTKLGQYIDSTDVSYVNVVYFDYCGTLGGSNTTGVYPLIDIAKFLHDSSQNEIVFAVTFCLRDNRYSELSQKRGMKLDLADLEGTFKANKYQVKKTIETYTYSNMAFVCLVLKKRTL